MEKLNIVSGVAKFVPETYEREYIYYEDLKVVKPHHYKLGSGTPWNNDEKILASQELARELSIYSRLIIVTRDELGNNQFEEIEYPFNVKVSHGFILFMDENYEEDDETDTAEILFPLVEDVIRYELGEHDTVYTFFCHNEFGEAEVTNVIAMRQRVVNTLRAPEMKRAGGDNMFDLCEFANMIESTDVKITVVHAISEAILFSGNTAELIDFAENAYLDLRRVKIEADGVTLYAD